MKKAHRHEARKWLIQAAAFNGRAMNAHRAVCFLAHGEAPSDMHTEAAHSCGNRKCCNPKHIRHATSVENKSDMLGHGTRPMGERSGRSKLKVEDVIAIRASDEKQATLARKFAISDSAVQLIRERKNWAWL